MGLIFSIIKWLYPDGFKEGCGRDLKMFILFIMGFGVASVFGKHYVDKENDNVISKFNKQQKNLEEKVKIQKKAVEKVFKIYHESLMVQLKTLNQSQRDLKEAIEITDNRVWEILKLKTN